MKILKSLNKKNFTAILIIIFCLNSYAEENPVDIWNVNENVSKETNEIDSSNNKNEAAQESTSKTNIYDMQSLSEIDTIKLEKNLEDKNKIFGLYDPEDNGLDINMWANSDGDQLKNIFKKIIKLNLSKDATELMNIALLTNAYSPKKNISEKEFLKLRTDWLIKKSDLELIEEYLIKNQVVDTHPNLSRYLVDQYLSSANVEKACDIFSKNIKSINDEYLFKFNIYCLIKTGKQDQAQVIFDLKKELGFKNKYFEKKINYLFGYDLKVDQKISDNSILEFHLAKETNPDFIFNPSEKTDKMIWKYLSSFNLLGSFKEIEISELDKISTIELAVHNKNYPEKDLFELYKRFQFNINQLLNPEANYKSLPKIEARALIYQKILLESEMVKKLKLLKILKDLFKEENIENAFDVELKNFLEKMDPLKIPDNLTSFYYTNIKMKIVNKEDNKLKLNNDILHQSKLVNYFNGEYSNSKIKKDVNNFLKKIKKNKKYVFSKKDIIFIESLKADGVLIEKKYDDLYEIDESEMPNDIQVMINNNEKGTALLRIIEVIGQDDLNRIDDDTMYFIINTLNQLNIRGVRDQMLLKVLPLKV